jgi:hypothetical protein
MAFKLLVSYFSQHLAKRCKLFMAEMSSVNFRGIKPVV